MNSSNNTVLTNHTFLLRLICARYSVNLFNRMRTPFFAILLAIVSGCASNHVVHGDARYHLISLKGNGSPYDLQLVNSEAATSRNSDARGYNFTEHLKDIVSRAVQKDEILISFHGGMNDVDSAIENVESIINKGQWNLEDTYPIFVNWESAMQKAYFDHIWRIRQGAERPGLAPATSIPYFLADLGRALTRAPIVWVGQLPGILPFQNEKK